VSKKIFKSKSAELPFLLVRQLLRWRRDSGCRSRCVKEDIYIKCKSAELPFFVVRQLLHWRLVSSYRPRGVSKKISKSKSAELPFFLVHQLLFFVVRHDEQGE